MSYNFVFSLFTHWAVFSLESAPVRLLASEIKTGSASWTWSLLLWCFSFSLVTAAAAVYGLCLCAYPELRNILPLWLQRTDILNLEGTSAL